MPYKVFKNKKSKLMGFGEKNSNQEHVNVEAETGPGNSVIREEN
jgi:hypothetical protein